MDNLNANKNPALYIIRVGGTLLVICALVALMLSLVNTFTRDKITENENGRKQDVMAELFESESVEFTELDRIESDGEGIDTIYRVAQGGATVGYCVHLHTPGFGGDIEMMVALTADQTVVGVKVLSMSETPGLGSQVGEEEYLSRYVGMGVSLSASDVDMIAGATKSSKAVLNGILDAMSALGGHLGSGGGAK